MGHPAVDGRDWRLVATSIQLMTFPSASTTLALRPASPTASHRPGADPSTGEIGDELIQIADRNGHGGLPGTPGILNHVQPAVPSYAPHDLVVVGNDVCGTVRTAAHTSRSPSPGPRQGHRRREPPWSPPSACRSPRALSTRSQGSHCRRSSVYGTPSGQNCGFADGDAHAACRGSRLRYQNKEERKWTVSSSERLRHH